MRALKTRRFESDIGRYSYPNEEIDAVFIPTKEMLTHADGLLVMAEKYREFPFDKTLLDIVGKAQQWKVRDIPQIAKNILPKLEQMMEGIVVQENDEFYIQKKNGVKVNFSIETEGLKKIGLLWQLLMNETIKEGSILLWDEPESNINPQFIPDIVEILLELQRNNVQIFLATHNYLLAKYFEVRKRGETFYSIILFTRLKVAFDATRGNNSIT